MDKTKPPTRERDNLGNFQKAIHHLIFKFLVLITHIYQSNQEKHDEKTQPAQGWVNNTTKHLQRYWKVYTPIKKNLQLLENIPMVTNLKGTHQREAK